MQALSQFREYFNPLFENYIQSCVADATIYDPDFEPIGEHLLLLARGGKRLRPFVAQLAYQSVGGKTVEELLPVLYALELFQIFALIHDDIMDGGVTRHQVECLHKKFDYKQALLVGNLCLVWAMRSIALDPGTTRAEIDIFMRLSEETNIGQMVDTALGQKRPITEALLERSIDLKTTRYTFIYPMLLGLSYAGVVDATSAFATMGKYLGTAFQRLDDVADIMFAEAMLGKRPCADIVDGTPTYLSYYFDQNASEKEKKRMKQFAGALLSDKDIAIIRQIFIESGAVGAEVKAIQYHLGLAELELKNLTLPDESYRYLWADLINFLRNKLNMLPKSLL